MFGFNRNRPTYTIVIESCLYNRLNDIHGNIYYRKDIEVTLSKYEKYGEPIQNANKSLKEIKSNILSTTKILLAISVPLAES